MRGVGILGLAGAAMAALAVPQLAEPHHMGRTRYPAGYKRRKGGSIAEGKFGGLFPHKHEREIARRKRQAERVRENRAKRVGCDQTVPVNAAGFSRRGRLAPL